MVRNIAIFWIKFVIRQCSRTYKEKRCFQNDSYITQNPCFKVGAIVSPVGKEWIKQMVVSASMLPMFVCGTAFLINFIAIYYHASRAIPFGTMVS